MRSVSGNIGSNGSLVGIHGAFSAFWLTSGALRGWQHWEVLWAIGVVNDMRRPQAVAEGARGLEKREKTGRMISDMVSLA